MITAMKRLRTIVVEDELLPRLALLKKLDDFSREVEVVDSCDTYDSARDSILRNRPDLLLLDIQLQGRDSIEMLEELRQTIALPYVIFTTAFSDREYLMSAIKLSAVDYLLKPVDKAELAHAIAKAADRAATEAPGPAPAVEKLSFKSASGKVFVHADDIAWFKADGNYAKIMTFSGEELILENLLSLEKRLPRPAFMRVDRSTIVNVGKVYRIDQRLRTCTMQSAGGRSLDLSLSKSGIETLMACL